jgi:hypothetical protein
LSKKQWSCDGVKRKLHAISDVELRQRLAEIFDLLVQGKSQQQNPPAFSKDFGFLKPLAPKPSIVKKGA